MSPQAGWILQAEVVPRLRASIPRNVHCVGSEDAEELIQDSIAIAAKMLHSAEAAGKTVTAGNIAYYALQLIRSGRRSTGSSVVDVMAPGTQLNGHAWLNSLDEPVADQTSGEGFTFNDVLASDQEDPATIAGRNLDWQMLLTRLAGFFFSYQVEARVGIGRFTSVFKGKDTKFHQQMQATLALPGRTVTNPLTEGFTEDHPSWFQQQCC
jgi:hypothetical protein